MLSDRLIPRQSDYFKIFIRAVLSIKILCLSLQPILDKNQRDINKVFKLQKTK